MISHEGKRLLSQVIPDQFIKNFNNYVTFPVKPRHIFEHRNFMKRNLLMRLMVVSFVTVCGLVYIQAGINKQIVDDQCTDEIPLTAKKRVSGEFIILQSITRYLTAGYH